jgi:hypothetical protein
MSGAGAGGGGTVAEEKKEKWLNWLALTTVIFAVCATLATFKGGGYSTRAVLSQTQASDQWAFYQAKSIKGYLYEVQREKLELEREVNRASCAPETLAAYDRTIAKYAEKTAKYDKEKEQIAVAAKAFEAARDDAKVHQAAFGVAVIFLQITILLSSVAALMKKRPVWYAALAVGAAGLVYFANGFLQFL